MLTSASSGSTSDATGGGKGAATASSPNPAPGDRLTGAGETAVTWSDCSSDDSEDSVMVAELSEVDYISKEWEATDLRDVSSPLEGPLSPTAWALGFLSDRRTIGWEKPDILKIY